MKRRTFLVWMGRSAATAPLLGVVGCDDPKTKPEAPKPQPPKAEPRKPYVYQFWNAKEQLVLGSVFLRILPGDPKTGAPSGILVGALEYLDRQMLEPHFADLHRMMRAGVDFIDRVAVKYHGGPFRSRTPEVQDQILTQFQMGTVPELKFPQERFFATLHGFALEGYWGPPKYGGNRDQAVWAWVDINPHCAHIHGSCTE